MTPERCAEILKKKVTVQSYFFKDLCRISRFQKELLLAGEYEKLTAQVQKRDAILRRLDILQNVITCYINYWNQTNHEVSPKAYRGVERAFESLKGAVSDLDEADRDLKSSLREEMKEMKLEILKTKKGVFLTSSYSAPKFQPKPRFVSKIVG